MKKQDEKIFWIFIGFFYLMLWTIPTILMIGQTTEPHTYDWTAPVTLFGTLLIAMFIGYMVGWNSK